MRLANRKMRQNVGTGRRKKIAEKYKIIYFKAMEASLTDLARKTKEVVRHVRAGKEVILTEDSQPFAKIIPLRKFDRKVVLKILREMGPIDLSPMK